MRRSTSSAWPLAFALCLLTVQLAAYQLSVGDFHEKKDRIFRVLGPPSHGVRA